MLCDHCQKTIPKSAKFCTECKKYQNPVLNFVIMLGTLSGGAALILGVLTYVSTTLPSYFRTLHQEDVSAITLRYSAAADGMSGVYGNSGAHTAFLRDILIYFPSRANALRSLGRSVDAEIAPGDLVHVKRAPKTPKGPVFSAAYAQGLKDDWMLSREWTKTILERPDCFDVVLSEIETFKTSLTTGEINKVQGKLLYVPAEAFIRYLPVGRSKWIIKKIPARAAIYTDGKNAACSEILGDLAASIPADTVVLP